MILFIRGEDMEENINKLVTIMHIKEAISLNLELLCKKCHNTQNIRFLKSQQFDEDGNLIS